MENKMPRHIAIIMDGNGRWAKKRFLPKVLGHRNGAQALNRLLKDADKEGLEHMTVYAFSTENWKRSKEEVDSLMKLMGEYIEEYIRDADTSNLKIDFIGDLSVLSDKLRERIEVLKEISSEKKGLKAHIALNYGSRDEMIRAIKKVSEEIKSGGINPDDITEDMFSGFLDTKDIPDPELIIRTSGELRLSNFLLWQAAYSEFYFTDKLWPDFTIKDLLEAVEQYNKRERRFGGRNEVK